MASPITHIILAIKIACLLPASMDQEAFIVGTSFPDIRHMAKLSRQATHIEPVSWHDIITESSSFRAGMLFHNLVDNLRIKHFEPYFYDRLATSHDSTYVLYFPLVMKFAEDAVLHSFTSQWQEACNCFDTIYPEELALCPDEETVQKWHSLIQNYCLHKPTIASINTFLSGVGSLTLNNKASLFNGDLYFNNLINNPIFQQKIVDFYNNFENLLGDLSRRNCCSSIIFVYFITTLAVFNKLKNNYLKKRGILFLHEGCLTA